MGVGQLLVKGLGLSHEEKHICPERCYLDCFFDAASDFMDSTSMVDLAVLERDFRRSKEETLGEGTLGGVFLSFTRL